MCGGLGTHPDFGLQQISHSVGADHRADVGKWDDFPPFPSFGVTGSKRRIPVAVWVSHEIA
jgi:hypothetical protein